MNPTNSKTQSVRIVGALLVAAFAVLAVGCASQTPASTPVPAPGYEQEQ